MIKVGEMLYEKQLEDKKTHLENLLSPYDIPSLSIYESPIQNFRMRAEFRIWHEQGNAHYAMFSKDNNKTPIFLEEFPYASVKINQLMCGLKEIWQTYPLIKEKLFQVEFLTTLSDESLITLCYHKKLDEEWLLLAKLVDKELNAKIVGRAKKQKLMTHDDFVQETLTILGHNYHYIQPENSFTQPNAIVNQKMITWACEHLADNNHDLLELYCGNGNFTIPFSHNVRRIFATEISKLSIKALQQNLQLNNIDNIELARLSALELTQAINEIRYFRRLAHIDLKSYNFETIFVDPPRAGLDEDTCQLTSQFSNIIYISCNPETLAKNLKELTKTHRITAGALFDQFPYSPHIETGIVLSKK
ncbi:tRNA (uridine(54)-C5)-methyltransferase TrmA [Neisseriaceae bacterium PsAf]|nr:tRNA (uridine(54)-C5)-methyltransferase TrmA [Neisseriaceae bacterium PsAf]